MRNWLFGRFQKHSNFFIYRFLDHKREETAPRVLNLDGGLEESCDLFLLLHPQPLPLAGPGGRDWLPPTFRTSSRLSSLAWSWCLSFTAESRSLVTVVIAWLSRAHSAFTYK